MAISLAESAKLSTNQMYQGIVKTVYTRSDILKMLQFITVKGNALQIARQGAATGTASDWYSPGDTWSESTYNFSQITSALKIMGGDAEVDNFAQQTRSTDLDQGAVQVEMKLNDLAAQFDLKFISGDEGGNAEHPNGLRVLTTSGNSNLATMGTNGATLTLAKLDELEDTVEGQIDAFIMTRRSRRKLKDLRRAANSTLDTIDMFGQTLEMYNGKPILINDHIGNALTKGSSTDCSEIYAVSFRPGFGVCGLQNEAMSPEKFTAPDGTVISLPGPQVTDLGEMETKDARKWRIRWYPGLVVFALRGVARLDGVRD